MRSLVQKLKMTCYSIATSSQNSYKGTTSFMLEKSKKWDKMRKKGKLGANWDDGPFKITQVIKPGIYELEDEKGKKLTRP